MAFVGENQSEIGYALNLAPFIQRNDYIDKIVPFLARDVIKVITGMRRVGKSYLIRMLIQALSDRGVPATQILWINKESMEWDHVSNHRELYTVVTAFFKDKPEERYLFIDEVQEIKDLYWLGVNWIAD